MFLLKKIKLTFTCNGVFLLLYWYFSCSKGSEHFHHSLQVSVLSPPQDVSCLIVLVAMVIKSHMYSGSLQAASFSESHEAVFYCGTL